VREEEQERVMGWILKKCIMQIKIVQLNLPKLKKEKG
jgi:hypothetical protein